MQNLKPNILIVDDDSRILKLLKQFLCKHSFSVSTASSTTEARKLLDAIAFDLLILDVMLPEVTGLEFAKTIRSNGSSIPIVMLTAMSEPQNRIDGLESGASDYLTKPFEPKELLLRINNLINYHNRKAKVKYLGNSYYNLESKEFIKKNQRILLSSTEQKLLEIFIENEGDTILREELCKIMGGLSPRSIDVQIARIRNKIEEDPKEPKYLITIRNSGYALYT